MKKTKLRKFTDDLKLVYEKCFGSTVIDDKQYWLPHLICNDCRLMFDRYKKNKTPLKFVRPMVWSEPQSIEDCFFCMTKTHGFNSSNIHKIEYAKISSVKKPFMVPTNEREEDQESDISSLLSELELEETDESDDKYVPTKQQTKEKGEFDQKELNDLVRELGLSKEGAELLTSRLKEKNLLPKRTKTSYYRSRDESFRTYFSSDTDLVYCHDVKGLMDEIKKDAYKADEWRLFIDSSERSLKAVLLHNTNIYSPIPIAHSVTLKEEYKNIEMVLNKIEYGKHNWLICRDLKILSMILGQQSGFTKFPCFLCLWDSRDRESHYVKTDWPARQIFEPGKKNIINKPLVEPSKVLLPPLHIKLGLMKQFVKALNKKGECFDVLGNEISANIGR